MRQTKTIELEKTPRTLGKNLLRSDKFRRFNDKLGGQADKPRRKRLGRSLREFLRCHPYFQVLRN